MHKAVNTKSLLKSRDFLRVLGVTLKILNFYMINQIILVNPP